jgi:acetate kinase
MTLVSRRSRLTPLAPLHNPANLPAVDLAPLDLADLAQFASSTPPFT